MAKREIYEVYAKVVDANGNYNTLSGYPKVFDSKLYGNDIGKARNRAYGSFHDVLGTMYAVDTRQVQLAMIFRASDGLQEALERVGELADLPDPEPEPPEEEPEGE